MLGDLIEEFHRRSAAGGPGQARRWFWWQTARALLPLAWHRMDLSPALQTGVAVAAGWGAMWAWTGVLNWHPVRSSLARLAGTPLSFTLIALELSAYFLGGLVLGRLARARPAIAVLAATSLVLGTPLVVRWATTGAPGPFPGPWTALLVLGGIGLGTRAAGPGVGRS